ncbi:MAG TPA: CocE/NonD family hydrolase, partial [Solirubrobacteraceae bacterium]
DDDPYWTARDFSGDVAEVTAPVSLVGGWHDIFLPWLLADFVALRRAGREARVVVGPWTHIAPGVMRTSLREALAWLRAHLLGDDRLLEAGPVRIWVGGAREWRTLPDWPPPGTTERRVHLQPGHGLDDSVPTDSAPDAFRYDPRDPTPSLGGPTLFERSPVVDNAPLEARDDVLVYTAEPLAQDREVIGPVRAEFFVRASRPHFDVFVRICDVDREGVSRNVCDGLVRVEPEARPADADGVVAVDVELWPTAHRFAAGPRLRVLVAAGAHPRYARNHGTGEPLGTATELVATDLEVLHDPAHPSAVVLSVQ